MGYPAPVILILAFLNELNVSEYVETKTIYGVSNYSYSSIIHIDIYVNKWRNVAILYSVFGNLLNFYEICLKFHQKHPDFETKLSSLPVTRFTVSEKLHYVELHANLPVDCEYGVTYMVWHTFILYISEN